MKPPTLNIDREKRLITITRKVNIVAMDVTHTQDLSMTFTQDDACKYIELLATGLSKLTTTPTPSGPK